MKWTSTFKTNDSKCENIPNPKHNFFKGNYKLMKEELEKINWDDLFNECTDVNQMTLKFEEIIKRETKNYVPLKKSNNKRKPQSPWIDFKAVRATRRKYHAWQRYLNCNSHSRYLQYVKERKKVSKIIKKAKKEFEIKIAKEASSNPKAFYRYANSYKKKATTFIRLKKRLTEKCVQVDEKGNDLLKMTATDEETAIELNDYFQSVFTKDDDTPALHFNDFYRTFVDSDHPRPWDLPRNDQEDMLEEIHITEDDVHELLMKVDPNKSGGDDGIHPRVLKECADVLCRPLYLIYRKSLLTSTVPNSWKKATITPLYKSDERDEASNYRPISITSQVGKLLEKLIRKQIMAYFEDRNLLSRTQHGFRQKRSCLTNLLEALDYITDMVDKGVPVDEIFLDFKKAFDKVSHERLIHKLDSMGIKGSVLLWISDFLNDRIQRVRVNGSYSTWKKVTSGVPQGSILGPLLFLAFINDLPMNLCTNINLFADDSKLYSIVSNSIDVARLQHDIDRCYEWSIDWKMGFHPKKCHVLHFGSKNEENTYKIGGTMISPRNYEKDLGVTVSDTLAWSEHIDNCAKKANRMVGIIKRTFCYMDKDMFLCLYKTFVRPHLEFCPEVWSPHLAKDVSVLEKVQRRATKLVPEYNNLSYDERLKHLGLFPLIDRRLRGDMITTYKILNGFLNVDSDKLTPVLSSGSQIVTRSHNKQLLSKVPRTNMRKNFFTNRIVLPWNTLSNETIMSETVDQFKARYDRERLRKFI